MRRPTGKRAYDINWLLGHSYPNRRVGVRFAAVAEIFVATVSTTVLLPTQPSVQWVAGQSGR